MGDRELELMALVVDDRIQLLASHILRQKVHQALLAAYDLLVVLDRQASVEVGVVPQPLEHVILVVRVVGEDLRVRSEGDQCAVGLIRRTRLRPPLLDATLEGRAGHLAITAAGDREAGREGVDGLRTDAVQSHGELEGLAVVLGSSVYYGDALDDLAKRNASAEVAHADHVVQQRDHDPAAGTHDELVDRVVYDFLEEYVDAVVDIAAVAQASDVHARAQPDMLQG